VNNIYAAGKSAKIFAIFLLKRAPKYLFRDGRTGPPGDNKSLRNCSEALKERCKGPCASPGTWGKKKRDECKR